jgi:glycosyltransferase involved in cell wall biosynthesis
MKVLHVPYSYHPDTMGGVEIHVIGLAREMLFQGVESLICAPGNRSESYRHGDLRVHRIAGWQREFRIEHGYEPDAQWPRDFGRILDDERPSLVHLHAHNHLVTFPAAREAKKRGLPLVFTYHECGASCRIGTLRRFGTHDCDGTMDEKRCTACTLHRLGLAPPVAKAVAAIPAAIGRAAGRRGMRGRLWTALRTRELIARRHAASREFLESADAVVASVEWARELLRINGVPPGKIVMCPLGVEEAPRGEASAPREETDGRLRVAILCRADPRKGLHVLVDALAREPALDVALDAFVVRQEGDAPYLAPLEARVEREPRMRILPAIAHERVVATLRGYDVLAVPSQAIETGPLVVLEAFAAGIPVLGSRVGGIGDLVDDERNGLLVPARDAAAWAHALRRLASDRTLVRRLTAATRPPRTMKDVAGEMHRLYLRVSRQTGHASASMDAADERRTGPESAAFAPVTD